MSNTRGNYGRFRRIGLVYPKGELETDIVVYVLSVRPFEIQKYLQNVGKGKIVALKLQK